MDTGPLDQQCWRCHLPLGNRALAACPSCGMPLHPPHAPADDANERASQPAVASREPALTPWMRTAFLAALIIAMLAGAGVIAGQLAS